MTETIQRTKKIGGSLMIRIPKDIVDLEHIQAGEPIKIEIQKIRKDWFGCTPGLNPWNKDGDHVRSKYE